MSEITVGTKLVAEHILPLVGNDVAPPLKEGGVYTVEEIFTCECGQKHYHIGLQSKYNWVTCHACKKPIPKGDIKHWCHPTRFSELKT